MTFSIPDRTCAYPNTVPPFLPHVFCASPPLMPFPDIQTDKAFCNTRRMGKRHLVYLSRDILPAGPAPPCAVEWPGVATYPHGGLLPPPVPPPHHHPMPFAPTRLLLQQHYLCVPTSCLHCVTPAHTTTQPVPTPFPTPHYHGSQLFKYCTPPVGPLYYYSQWPFPIALLLWQRFSPTLAAALHTTGGPGPHSDLPSTCTCLCVGWKKWEAFGNMPADCRQTLPVPTDYFGWDCPHGQAVAFLGGPLFARITLLLVPWEKAALIHIALLHITPGGLTVLPLCLAPFSFLFPHHALYSSALP